MATKTRKAKKEGTAQQADPAGLALLSRGLAAELARRCRSARGELLALLLDPAFADLRATAALVTNGELDPLKEEPGLLAAFRRRASEIAARHLLARVPAALGRPAVYWWQKFTEAARSKGHTDATSTLGGALASVLGSLGRPAASAASRAIVAVERQAGVFLEYAGRFVREAVAALILTLGKAEPTAAQAGRAIAAAVAPLLGWQARRLARYELQAEYAAGQLEGFASSGVGGVRLLAELATAGDGKVCPACQARAGVVYTLEEAEGVIPLHIGCRCVWLPVLPSGPLVG